ncbi:hypothetical protein HK102_001364, partial [Quaeritorhiza haematococci]
MVHTILSPFLGLLLLTAFATPASSAIISASFPPSLVQSLRSNGFTKAGVRVSCRRTFDWTHNNQHELVPIPNFPASNTSLTPHTISITTDRCKKDPARANRQVGSFDHFDVWLYKDSGEHILCGTYPGTKKRHPTNVNPTISATITSCNGIQEVCTPQRDFFLVSYNIHGFNTAGDPPPKSFFNWWGDNRLYTMADRLNVINVGLKPDVLILQEAWDTRNGKILARQMNYQEHFKATGIDLLDGKLYGNGLDTLSDWEVLETGGEGWGYENRDQWEHIVKKGWTFARIRHRVCKDFELDIYNLHGIASSNNPPTKELQDRILPTYVRLGEFINQKSAGRAVIVAGDYNQRHRWRPRNIRPERGDYDPNYSQSAPDILGDFMALTNLQDADAVVSNTYSWIAGVDKVFFRDSGGGSGNAPISLRPISVVSFNGDEFKDLSDHTPLAA